MPRQPVVYIMASGSRGTLYVGVTGALVRRVWEHRTGAVDGFTKEYGVTRLVCFEPHATMVDAIRREKQIKRWNRAWKIELIERANRAWTTSGPRSAGTRSEHGPRLRGDDGR